MTTILYIDNKWYFLLLFYVNNNVAQKIICFKNCSGWNYIAFAYMALNNALAYSLESMMKDNENRDDGGLPL